MMGVYLLCIGWNQWWRYSDENNKWHTYNILWVYSSIFWSTFSPHFLLLCIAHFGFYMARFVGNKGDIYVRE
ncbi:hypothetical protein yaldo0001_37740 [Yersinia aldovae ATCC 35236]|nr:hypothetical protein yaldo0001_37740 [Yersinia aldovae ATCC 35236]